MKAESPTMNGLILSVPVWVPNDLFKLLGKAVPFRICGTKQSLMPCLLVGILGGAAYMLGGVSGAVVDTCYVLGPIIGIGLIGLSAAMRGICGASKAKQGVYKAQTAAARCTD